MEKKFALYIPKKLSFDESMTNWDPDLYLNFIVSIVYQNLCILIIFFLQFFDIIIKSNFTIID